MFFSCLILIHRSSLQARSVSSPSSAATATEPICTSRSQSLHRSRISSEPATCCPFCYYFRPPSSISQLPPAVSIPGPCRQTFGAQSPKAICCVSLNRDVGCVSRSPRPRRILFDLTNRLVDWSPLRIDDYGCLLVLFV